MITRKYNKIITILTIITTILTLISIFFRFILPIYLSYEFKINTNKVNSIGIIGSADGPTSIFIGNMQALNNSTILFALLSVIGIVYLIYIKK